LSRHDQHFVTTAQQISRQDDELPLGPTPIPKPLMTWRIRKVTPGSSQLLIQRACHIWEASSSYSLCSARRSPAQKTYQQAPVELSVKEALSGDQAGLDIPIDQYPHIPL